jgi:hypothetical protein
MAIAVGMALVAASEVAIGYKAYEIGFDHARIQYVDVPGPVQYVNVDVPGPVQYVNVDVPGPVQLYEVDVVVPGPTVVKKVFVPKPRHCPSVADALNEYEAISPRVAKMTASKTPERSIWSGRVFHSSSGDQSQ